MLTVRNPEDGTDDPMYKAAKETQTQRRDLRTQWEEANMGWFEGTALKHTLPYVTQITRANLIHEAGHPTRHRVIGTSHTGAL